MIDYERVQLSYQKQADDTYKVFMKCGWDSRIIAENIREEDLENFLKVDVKEFPPVPKTNILAVLFPTSRKKYYFMDSTGDNIRVGDEVVVIDNEGKESVVDVVEIHVQHKKKKPTAHIIRKHVVEEIPNHLDKVVKRRKNGTNSAISFNLLPEEKLRALGFTDHREGYWYFCRMLRDEISFSVSFPKSGKQDKLEINVLDENFLQPYDYQHMLMKHPDNLFAPKIQRDVEKWMAYLQDNGVLSGHEVGHYI